MAPIVHGLEVEYFGLVNFVYLDRDDPKNEEFLKTLGFQYQPHFILVNGEGEILQQWLGPVTADEFRTALNSTIQ
jgi:hypothetical protein